MKKFDGKNKWRVISAHMGWQNYQRDIFAMYHEKNMSGNEIAEYINQNIPRGLNITITPRSIQRTVIKYGQTLGIMKSTRDIKTAFTLAINRGRVKWHYKEFKYKRRSISQKLRYIALKRDDYKCVKCGNTAENSLLEVDHIIPICKGGLTVIENLQTLCYHCNKGKQIVEKEL
jgi:hypothetical protein